MSVARPGPLDFLDLVLLRLVKLRRAKFEDAGSFYETFFTEDDIEKYLGDVRNRWRLGRLRQSYRALFGDGPADVADIGCGLGIAKRFLPAGARYVGVEYGAETLALAGRIHGAGEAAFRQGGFPDLPLDSESADFVLCLEVIEHIADDRQAVGELARIVRPGGHLLISVPGTYYWPDYLRLIGHHRHYSRASLTALLAPHGFTVVRGFAQFDSFWRRYHYLYLCFKAFELVVRKTVSPGYNVFGSALYRALARRIEARLTRRDPADAPESTFLLCRKSQPARAAT